MDGDNIPTEPIIVDEPVIEDGGYVAERYVVQELAKARTGLARTRIGSLVVVLVLGGYMLYISTTVSSMRPASAAEITHGILTQRVQQHGPEIADYFKREIPGLIRRAPDYVLAQLPKYREGIETRVADELKAYSDSTTEQLGDHLDKFLDTNKDQVNAMLESGDNPDVAEAMGVKLKADFNAFLSETPPGGESIKTKLDAALVSLQQVEERSKRLAYAKDLNPSEKKARRAVAIMLTTIDDAQAKAGPGGAPMTGMPSWWTKRAAG